MRLDNNSEHQYDIVCIVTLYPKICPWEDRGCAPRKGLLTLHPRGRAEATIDRLSVLSSEARRRLRFSACMMASHMHDCRFVSLIKRGATRLSGPRCYTANLELLLVVRLSGRCAARCQKMEESYQLKRKRNHL